MPPFVAALLKEGLGMLAGAVMSKGKAVVEEKLGISLDQPLTPELKVKLKELEYQHEQWLLEAGLKLREQELQFQGAQEAAVTDRWKADMTSDSWLSKNVRPAVLLYILTAYTLLALLSGFDFKVDEAYVTLLGQWGIIVMTAYFGGRSLEKIMTVKGKR